MPPTTIEVLDDEQACVIFVVQIVGLEHKVLPGVGR